MVNRLELAIAQAIAHDKEVALLFIDLDRFKPVNDRHGHAVGDELLRLVAFRLQSVLREGDTVARLGGDEFVALLPDLTIDDALPTHTAEKISAALAQSFLINEQVISISGSIGIARFPHDACDADTLLNSADKAMYTRKRVTPGER